MKIHSNISSYISTIDKITHTKDYSLIYSNHKIYCYKDGKSIETNDNTFYLDEIGFVFYLKRVNKLDDDFSLFLVSQSSYTPFDILGELYCRSNVEIKITEERVHEIYDDLVLQYDQLFQHYFLLQDQIEEMFYPQESYYYLLCHMSDIYRLLSLGRFFLEKWMMNLSQPYICHEVYTILNISPSNFILGNVIHVDNGRRVLSVVALSHLYHTYYYENDLINSTIELLNNLSLNEWELFLLYAQLAILKKIYGDNLTDVQSLIYYVQNTYSFLLKKYHEYQESYNNEFQE